MENEMQERLEALEVRLLVLTTWVMTLTAANIAVTLTMFVHLFRGH